ncbi:energy transducer TonB family protein [Salinimicrobium sp. TH3]|uniref:energy transducer TonB family protein n=1 Tax=Salinimicrobium sp. TH3 TaxID=2997342 RepID=UPI0022766243|nr:energy transducer TonB [Salinimicrobium sp. TH3]MCY2686230.1 energy transducer TonB [Salinimicrobium sp. TH3]
MDFFDRHKALIITTLIFSILILSMYNINISNESKKIRETLIELNELRPLPAPQEEQPQPEEPEPAEPQRPGPTVKTHQAFNQNQEESQRNLESRLDEIFEKNSAQQEASQEESAEDSKGEIALNNSRKQERKKASEGDNTSKETSVKQGTMRSSSISFSLRGRSAIDIPNPIYTCDTPGRVVVNITVNATGDVVKTSINKNASSTSNECLTNMAMEYAANAKFSQLPGRNSQPGTITYNFQN